MRVRVNTYSSVFLPPFAPTLTLPLCRCHVAASLIKFHISKVPSSVRRDKDDRYIHLLLSLRRPVMDVCICHIKGEKKNHLWLHSGADSALPAILPLSFLSAVFPLFHPPALVL